MKFGKNIIDRSNNMSIKTRLPKIKQTAQEVRLCLRKSKHLSVWAVRSSSDPTISYQMRIEWISKRQIEDICFPVVQLSCNTTTMEPCKGMNHWLCKHSLAALSTQYENIRLFDNFSDAYRYSNFGGKLIKITSQHSTTYGWGVITKQTNYLETYDPHLAKRMRRFNERVDMFRGEKEKGID
jgi:hypothetical protein